MWGQRPAQVSGAYSRKDWRGEQWREERAHTKLTVNGDEGAPAATPPGFPACRGRADKGGFAALPKSYQWSPEDGSPRLAEVRLISDPV